MSSTKKLVVVGDGACGKTCLLVVFSKNEFPEDYIPTIYDLYFKKLETDDCEIEFALWDTAGEEEYDRLRPLAYPRTNVVLICFSVDNPDSFINVKEKWAPEVKHFCSHVPVILVANKLDLRYNPDIQSHLKKTNLETVKYNQGLKMAKKIKADDYVECSAKTMEGVTQVFTSAARAALRTKKLCKNRICKIL